MNDFSGSKTLILSLVGLTAVLLGIVLLLLTRWYAGLVLVIPAGALNVMQLKKYFEAKRK